MPKTFSISSRGLPTVTVQAENWLVALGKALGELDAFEGLDRLACEALPNGSIIARNVTSGAGYVVQQGSPLEGQSLVELDMRRAHYDEALAAAEDRAAACQSALRLAQEAVQCSGASVILLERGYLRFQAVSGPAAAKLVGVRIPAGVGIAGYAMERRCTVLLTDAGRDPRHCKDVDAVTGFETHEMLVAPLVAGSGPAMGVLELVNRPDSRDFSEADGRLIEVLGWALAARLSALQR